MPGQGRGMGATVLAVERRAGALVGFSRSVARGLSAAGLRSFINPKP